MARPPSIKFVTAVLRRVQRYRRWDAMFVGRCGPAAIAINEILLNDAGKYLVKIRRSSRGALPYKWCGHVALLYKGRVFDYEGLTSWENLALWHHVKTDKPVVIVDALRAEVVRHFADPCGADLNGKPWSEIAGACLRRARQAELKSRSAA